jgi:hypothetical protein
MDTVLIGKPELFKLGIDPDSALTKHLEDAPDYHVEAQCSTCAVLEPAKLRLLSITDSKTEPGSDYNVDIGDKVSADIADSIERMIQRANEMGLDSELIPDLKRIVYKYKDVWRIKLGEDQPARVTPQKLHFIENHSFARCKNRRYPPAHQDFMKNHTCLLEKYGYIYRNPSSRYASAALVFSKPGSDNYRLCIDTKEFNKLIQPTI